MKLGRSWGNMGEVRDGKGGAVVMQIMYKVLK